MSTLKRLFAGQRRDKIPSRQIRCVEAKGEPRQQKSADDRGQNSEAVSCFASGLESNTKVFEISEED